MNSKRKIAVITGTRAEYGLLKPLLEKIKEDSELHLQLIATGMHLSPEFGMTHSLIENDGFDIDEKVEMLLSSDSAIGVSKSVGLGVISFTDSLNRLKPDILVLLGDRFEILAAAQAALFLKIPIAHIHGGELTQGALDDNIRHCVTKMSALHFTSCDTYRRRVLQLGESPDCVFNVGALGVERIKKANFIEKRALENKLKIQFSERNFLFSYHPETKSINSIDNDLNQLFSAIDSFENTFIIFTKSNADESGRRINAAIDQYVNLNSHKAKSFITLGDHNYLSILNVIDVIIGNSSSGIIEAPSFHVPTVNVGNRQFGRVRAESIIDCSANQNEIKNAITLALSDSFKNKAKKTISPYDGGNTSNKIKDILKTINLSELLSQQFFDLKEMV